NELQEQRRQNRQLKGDNEQLQKNLEALHAELKRAQAAASQAESGASQREAETREELNRVIERHQKQAEQLAQELATWKVRHEEQCNANHELEDKAAEAAKLCAEAQAAREEIAQKLEGNNRLIDALLARIDWAKVGTAMKPSPTVKRNFSSLVRRLDYDSNRQLTIEATLPVFWARLSRNEKELIDAISRSNSAELANGDIQAYWQSIKDQFSDVLINLEARQAMLGMLQEIFFQAYSTEDLEEPTFSKAPATRSTKKKSEEK
ncbi:MAG: hypothetical protein IJJ26_13140, partial [Victivallales bacterium]|nr:hypothetical protein [Victivallales bacterium]